MSLNGGHRPVAPAATTGRQAPRQMGFTLLEIMVVVVLIAISASFVILNLQRDVDQVAEREARRFALLVAQARDESILSGRPYAVEVNTADHWYRFFVFQSDWVAVDNDDVFRRRRIPEDLQVAFEVQEGPEAKGRLMIEGLGEITPFELSLRGDSRTYTVSLVEDQEVVVTEHRNEG